MNAGPNKRLIKAIGIFVVGTVVLVILFLAVRTPSIVTWQATSFEVDHSLSQRVSIEAQISAIEKRDPHKDFVMFTRDQNLFLYAVADARVIIPGVDRFTPPFRFPVRVITGTGESGAGARNDYLNQIARKFAEQFNKEMYRYILTW